MAIGLKKTAVEAYCVFALCSFETSNHYVSHYVRVVNVSQNLACFQGSYKNVPNLDVCPLPAKENTWDALMPATPLSEPPVPKSRVFKKWRLLSE
jgi:hypothetical protein